MECHELERAGAMDREFKAGDSVPDFCILFAERALRLASTGGKKEVQKMMRVIFDPSADAGEL